MTRAKANICGVVSIFLLGLVVSAIRLVSEAFGAEIGAACLYTVSGLILLLTIRLPKIKEISKFYLLIASILFVGYEICFSLAIGYSQNHRQTMEIGAINYLWPCLTVLLSIILNKEKVKWFIFPAVVCTFLGIFFVVSGSDHINFKNIAHNVSSNPISYILMFIGAFLWALYCNITKRYGNGQNLIALFFIVTAIVLWGRVLNTHNLIEIKASINLSSLLTLGFAGMVMAGSYALWNISVLRGNILLLATASNFIPVLSAVLSLILLNANLNYGFWIGVILVTLGSLFGFYAVRKK